MKDTAPEKRTSAAVIQNQNPPQSRVSLKSPNAHSIHGKSLDELVVNIKRLELSDVDNRYYNAKVYFSDQLLISQNIRPLWSRAKGGSEDNFEASAKGSMRFDPSDYGKMSLFADNPLVVQVVTVKTLPANKEAVQSKTTIAMPHAAYCCNIDILPVFIEHHTICVKRRLQPNVPPTLFNRTSWNNLPLLTVEISVVISEDNHIYRKMLLAANCMKITLVGAYNLIEPYDQNYEYTAATKMPVSSEANTTIVRFSQGQPLGEDHSDSTGFFPKWESLRINDAVFSNCYEKFNYNLEELHNPELYPYLEATDLAAVWGSFHRTLMLNHTNVWLKKHLRQYQWPLEVHLYGKHSGYSFMGFIDLTRLLYPGEQRVLVAVPLEWVKSQVMMQKCGCGLLLTPMDRQPTSSPSPTKGTKSMDSSPPTTTKTYSPNILGGGSEYEGDVTFVILEVALRNPLVKASIPPHVSHHDLCEMLLELEKSSHYGKKRECVGRGQLRRDWDATMRLAVQALRKVPYYGTTDFVAFNRQLSETRTRIELMTSCQKDAALYVNNNFCVNQYLQDDTSYAEMLRIAHLCLVRETVSTLVPPPQDSTLHPLLRAARHARQMQDYHHALNLYLEYLTERKRDSNVWREVGTCLKDLDLDWAMVCFQKSISIDPVNPLTLVAMGCMVFDEDPVEAEPFFESILILYPLWATGWLIVSIYYHFREYHHLADKICEQLEKTVASGLEQDYSAPRTWESELGDWWDSTPLGDIGMSRYFDAADLLLRLRVVAWAEFSAARILTLYGESPMYHHIIALCCRLQGKHSEALCLIKNALEQCDHDLPVYLRSLQAECHHKLEQLEEAMAAFNGITGVTVCPYSTLLGLPRLSQQRSRTALVDMLRRQPSAYGWMAMARDWLSTAAEGEQYVAASISSAVEDVSAEACAIACAVQALRIDRRAGRAWALLAEHTWPEDRRVHCREMARWCGYSLPDDNISDTTYRGNQMTGYVLGWTLKECRCCMCYHFQIS